MIRFLIDQFRNMPGPLKKPRILVADLTEEVIDLAEQFLKRRDSDVLKTGCCDSDDEATVSPEMPSPAPAVVDSGRKSESARSHAPSRASSKNAAPSAADVDPRLIAAISVPANLRKQEFKVMAILWEAHSKKMGALSAKAISKMGEETLNVQIRHENVRKVIRMRLENYVKVHAQGVGNGTVYNYELADAGVEYFVSTYLK